MKSNRFGLQGMLFCALMQGLLCLPLQAQDAATDAKNDGDDAAEKGDFDAAIADYTKAIALKPDFSLAYLNRGVAKADKGDFDGAIADDTKDIELDPRSTLAYNNRAIAKRNKGDLDGSIADWSQIIAIDPQNSFAYFNRGFTRDKNGDHEGAAEDYSKSREITDYLKTHPKDSVSKPKPAKKGGITLGTGFFVTTNGYLLTDLHVVKNASSISVKTGANLIPAQLVAQDVANDVAILKVEGSFPCLPLGDSDKVSLGQGVFTVGFPDPDLQGLSPKLTKGEISSVAGMKDDPRMFQISVPVQPGSSGGSLVDESGNVVGLIEASLSTVATAQQTGELLQNVNYATKIAYAKILLDTVPDAKSALVPVNTSTVSFTDEVKMVQGATVFIIAGSSGNQLPSTHLYTDSNGNTYSVSDSDYERLHPQRKALDAENTKLNQMDAQYEAQARGIEIDRQYLDNTNPQAVDNFNAEVDRHNAFGDQIHQETGTFNDEVDRFNAELKRVGTLVK
jgi:S1-C subfamily serine protease